MKKLLLILMMFIGTLGYSQQLTLSDTSKIFLLKIADDNSFLIIKNDINIEINDNIKRKIEIYRKKNDYIWKPEEGLEILIYKK
jgi:hypothetical protein